MKKRILFMSEGVTAAHVVRPYVLAKGLDKDKYEVHFACTEDPSFLKNNMKVTFHKIKGLNKKVFKKNLERGWPLFPKRELGELISEDLKIIEKVQPDLIVGDFRLSLSISAKLMNVRYANICNAYWSPSSNIPICAPENPISKVLGKKMADPLFKYFFSSAMSLHAGGFNHYRTIYGLPTVSDIREIYLDGDLSFFPDLPELVSLTHLSRKHKFIGDINWSPEVSFPDWWGKLPKGKPNVYLSLGSSGQIKTLPKIIKALSKMDVNVMFSTSGREINQDLPENFYPAEYLPGTEVCRIADVVICNGGSPSGYQALAEEVPVIGIASNLDQFMSMSSVTKFGAGILLRAYHLKESEIQNAVKKGISHSPMRGKAKELAKSFSSMDAVKLFESEIDSFFKRSTCTFIQNDKSYFSQGGENGIR